MEESIEEVIRRKAIAGEKEFAKSYDAAKSVQTAHDLLSKFSESIEGGEQSEDELTDLRKKLEGFRIRLQNAIRENKEPHENQKNGLFVTELIEEINIELHQLDPFRLSNLGSMRERSGTWSRIANAASPRSAQVIRYLRGTNNIEGDLSSEEKAFCFHGMAWIFAILGMFISLSFLTADYVVSSRNPTTEVGTHKNRQLELPAVTGCYSMQGIPTFDEYPTGKYPGYPLFLLQYVSELEKAETIMYPSTLPISEKIYVNSGNVNCSYELQRMSVRRATASIYANNPSVNIGEQRAIGCKACLRTGGLNRRTISGSTLERSEVPLELKYLISELIKLCLFQIDNSTFYLRRVIEAELKKHWKKLQTLGILDFGDYEPGNDDKVDALSRSGFSDDYRKFLCNVYFYSGYFYPNSGEDIRYRYERMSNDSSSKSQGIWAQSGKGPYFDPPWRKTMVSNNTSTDIIDQPGTNQQKYDIWGTNSLELYAQVSSAAKEEPHVSFKDLVWNLEMGSIATLRFRQIIEEGELKFEHSIIQSKISQDIVKSYTEYHVNVELGSNYTETITTKPSMSFVEYLTDFMEFAGLFTGVCLFSILVAPANVYLTHFRRKPRSIEE